MGYQKLQPDSQAIAALLEAREFASKKDFRGADILYHSARRLAENILHDYKGKGDSEKTGKYKKFLVGLEKEIAGNRKKLEEEESSAKTGRYAKMG